MSDRISSLSATSTSSSSVTSTPPPSLSQTQSRQSQREIQQVYSVGDPNDFSLYQHGDDLDSTLRTYPTATVGGDEEKAEEATPPGPSQFERWATHRSSTRVRADGQTEVVVGWDGPDDPENPRNWPLKRKWMATFVVSSFALMSTISTSMVAPCLPAMSREFGVTNEVQAQLMLSLFVLAYAIGPLMIAPLSEVYGRVHTLQLPNLFFLAFNLACGFAQNKSELMVFRFLAGLGGSAPLGIGGGVLADVWAPEQRGLSVSIYSLAPLLGPAIGPIAGGFIAEKTTWRWAFWATTIADALVQVLGVLFLRESYAPVLFQRKAARLSKNTGKDTYVAPGGMPNQSVAYKLRHALIRPLKMLGTQPTVQVIALFMAFLYGLMYLVLSTFPGLWNAVYHESVGVGSLNYISLGIGFFLGAQIPARLNDIIYRRLKARNGGTGTPEFRVPLMVPGSLFVPIGLFIYGWSAQYHVHWIVPNIGAAVFAAGTIMSFQCMQTYLLEAYTTFAASAVAAATMLRSLAGFAFPLFAPYMYQALHYGWGNSLLGFIAVGLGIPLPFLLWFYGPALRARSQYAAGSGLP